MRATFKALAPETIEMSMTLSMPLEQWKRLREQVMTNSQVWPLCDFVANVQSVIRAAEQHFESMEDRRDG